MGKLSGLIESWNYFNLHHPARVFKIKKNKKPHLPLTKNLL
jgi:hypothetical protein